MTVRLLVDDEFKVSSGMRYSELLFSKCWDELGREDGPLVFPSCV